MNYMQDLISSMDLSTQFRDLGWTEANSYDWPGDDRIRPLQKAIQEGKPIFNINSVFARAGIDVFDTGLPTLAICRADSAFCVWEGAFNGFDQFKSLENEKKLKWYIQTPRLFGSSNISVERVSQTNGNFDFAVARAPYVPVQARKTLNPRNCFIIWEAEWVTHKNPPMPRDPALATHLFDEYYALEATWDLTDSEMAAFGL